MTTDKEVTMKVFIDDLIEDVSFQVYDAKTMKSANDAISVYISDSTKGEYTVEAQKGGTYVLKSISYMPDSDKGSYSSQKFISYCTVTVDLVGLEEERIVCALGTSRELTLGNCQPGAIFTISDPEIATISPQGRITPNSLGDTQVKVEVKLLNGEERIYYCRLETTDPSVTFHNSLLQLYQKLNYTIEGDSYFSEIETYTSKPSVLDENFYSYKPGTVQVAVHVDGKKFSHTVQIVDISPDKNIYLLTKGSKTKVKLKGVPKGSQVTYSVTDKSIASVTQTGEITAKKNGNAGLTIQIDSIKLECGVSVSTKESVKAVTSALAVVGSPYSQEKRMQKGFYDCSSLMWRSYEKSGVYLGNKTWAPTAADLAKTMVAEKKIIAHEEEVNVKDLRAGDLLFFAGENNGRYLNIYHVAMFTGAVSYVDYYGEHSFIGTTVEALGGGVVETYYGGYGHVLIARPTK